MNKERRKVLSNAIELLETAKSYVEDAYALVETCKDDEEECYDNLPEGIQESERGEALQENVDDLDNIYMELESIADTISEQTEAIQDVISR